MLYAIAKHSLPVIWILVPGQGNNMDWCSHMFSRGIESDLILIMDILQFFEKAALSLESQHCFLSNKQIDIVYLDSWLRDILPFAQITQHLGYHPMGWSKDVVAWVCWPRSYERLIIGMPHLSTWPSHVRYIFFAITALLENLTSSNAMAHKLC